MIAATFIAAILIPLALLIGLRRIEAVYRYRVALIDRIAGANREAINAIKRPSDLRRCDGICEPRWAWLRSVSFGSMVYQFWKPLDSFYGPMPNGETDEWPDVIAREWDTQEEDAAWKHL